MTKPTIKTQRNFIEKFVRTTLVKRGLSNESKRILVHPKNIPRRALTPLRKLEGDAITEFNITKRLPNLTPGYNRRQNQNPYSALE